jgi:hypothetical protein
MTFKELKEFIAQIPDDFDNYELVNGEVGYLDPTDENSLAYRLDKPIIALYVDEQTKEVCFFHQTREDVTKFFGKEEGKEYNDDITEDN